MSTFSRFRSAASLLLLCACLCLSSSAVRAQEVYQLNVTAASGQAIGAGFRVFAGAAERLTVTHQAPSAYGEGTTVTLTCVTDTMLTGTPAAFTVTPATQCLSSQSVSFTITAGAKAVGALSNSPTCTFTVQGLNATAFAVPTLGAIEIRAPQKLTVPTLLRQATDYNNPLQVFATSIDYTYLAGAEEAAVGTVQLMPTCTLLSRVTANPQMDSNLNLNFTITFDSLGYVHCTLTFVMSSALDTGRYGSPASLYFKVVPDASTVLVIGVDDLKFSPLQNTTNILTISPTPQLTEEEYLEISITGCSGFGGALSAGVTPVWSQNTVRFGWGASTLKTLALMLPTFAYGGLHASCDVSFTGTISALQRYQTQSTIDIRASKKVQLTAELDLVTTPLGMFNPVLGAQVSVAVTLPAGVYVTLGQDLTVDVLCNVDCKGNNGYVDYAPSSQQKAAGDWMRNSTGDLTNGPLVMFTAQTLGTVECTWTLSGDDAEYYTAPANTYFNIRKPIELSINADSGLASPITSEPTEEFEPYSYTKNALNLGANPTITITVSAMQRNLEVSLSCGQSGVLNMTVSGADSNAVTSWTSGMLTFTSLGNTAGKFMIAPTIDSVRLNGGITCSWTLSGQAAFLYATPAPLSFYVGTVTELKATLIPAPFRANLVWAVGASSNDANTARINVTAKVPSALVGMDGLVVDYVCKDDLQVFASTSPSTAYFPVGSFGDGAQFSVIPVTSSTVREKNQGNSINVKCTFSLDPDSNTNSMMDVRAYKAPDSLSFSFQPKPFVAVSGSALQNNPVASASTQTLDFTLTSLPASGGEMVTLNITCPGFVENAAYLQWTSASNSMQRTTWTMPTVTAGNGNTVKCSFTLWSDNNKYRMTNSVSITIGKLRTWTQSPATSAIPTVWPGQETADITLTPSGCLAGGQLFATCVSDSNPDVTWGSISFGGSSFLTLTEQTENVVFTFTAPRPFKYSNTKCTFRRTWSNAFTLVAFEDIATITFQMGGRAAIMIDGMSDGHTKGDAITLSVRPTTNVGVSGLTVVVRCLYNRDTNTGSNIALTGPNTFYWFAGTSMSQTFTLTLPSTANVYSWRCWAEVQTAFGSLEEKLSDSDYMHFDDYAPLDSNGNYIVYWVGSPMRFSLGTADGSITGTPFLQKGCNQDGQTTITVRIPGSAPANTLVVTCFGTDTNPDTALAVTNSGDLPGGSLRFEGPICGAENSLTFTVDAGSYTGAIQCSYSSQSFPVTQLAPAKSAMYAGTTDINAITESDKLSKGAIAGIVIGCIVGAGLIVLVIVMVLMRGGSGGSAPKSVQQTPAVPMTTV